MISGDSRKQPSEAELAALLHGLRYRGLVVGPDDAVRVAAVFRHADSWSHQRRIRVLKSLVARSQEERVVIDQLAPFLFVNADKAEAQPAAAATSLSVSTASTADEIVQPRFQSWSDAGKKTQSRRSQQGPAARQEQDVHEASQSLRPKSWRAALVIGGLIVMALFVSPRKPDTPGTLTSNTKMQETGTSKRDAELLTTSGQAQVEVYPPRWPWGILITIFSLLIFQQSAPLLRFRRQQFNIDKLAASTGPRTYRLDLPASRAGTPLDPDLVREAAFQLSAASASAPAPWLDVQQTVDTTVKKAGQLTLCFDTWFEHRPVIFIEDVTPSMARWSQFGSQIVAALSRQGGEVHHYFMDRMPHELSSDRDMQDRAPLEQILAGFSEPTIIVLSDATAVEQPGALSRSSWIGPLAHATWLHPRTPELWGPGVRALAERISVISLSDDGLLRLGTPQSGPGETAPRRWRPAQVIGRESTAHINAMRAALGEATFWWLTAGAVLDRVGTLNTRLWWALHSEKIIEAPRDRLERVWELPEVNVAPDGHVAISPDVREALIKVFRQEQPALASAVVQWAVSLVAADLNELDATSLAAVEARVIQARLQLLDVQLHDQAQRNLHSLAQDGFGEWVEVHDAEENVIQPMRLSLARAQKPSKERLATVAFGCAGLILSAVLFVFPIDFTPPSSQPIEIVLEATVNPTRIGTLVNLSWEIPQEVESPLPAQWQVWRNDEQVAQVADLNWQDQPSGSGPWQYQVRGVGADQDRPFASNLATITFDMVEISAGAFFMGCNEKVDTQCDDDEKPGHSVYLDAYSIDTFEVTVADYQRCVETEACSVEGLTEYSNCNWEKRDRTDHPLNCVDWEQATAYCAWAGKRLPTEAEWEKAARGDTDRRLYPWGNIWDSAKANTNESGQGGTVPVGSYPAGMYGLYDMAGNVWEWMSDWYDVDYYKQGSNRNMNGPENGGSRVLRGGSWYGSATYARVSGRSGGTPVYRSPDVGFRCAR